MIGAVDEAVVDEVGAVVEVACAVDEVEVACAVVNVPVDVDETAGLEEEVSGKESQNYLKLELLGAPRPSS